MRNKLILKILCFIVFLYSVIPSSRVAAKSQGSPSTQDIVLVGGTLIDVSNFGNSRADVADAVIVIRGSEIVAAGKKGKVKIPAHAQIVDVAGKYIIPGLVDGFAGMNSQSQANAYLYMGVTSIVARMNDNRRGKLFVEANPAPHVYLREIVGYKTEDSKYILRPEAETLKQVEELARAGVKLVMLHYPITAERTEVIVRRAHQLGMAVIGELGFTSYTQAIKAGVDSFVHTPRYSMELAPPEMRDTVARDPFGKYASTTYYDFLIRLSPDDLKLNQYATLLASSKVGLIPTLSIVYFALPGHRNLWLEPIASILNPKDIHIPANPQTGNYDRDVFPQGFPESLFKFEEKYRQAGARYLTGSGTSAFGTMPGISLHTEMELLTRIGLTPRQALAAATNNFHEIYGWKRVGQVKAGYNADIVVVDENPLVDIRNAEKIRMVILSGKIINRDKLLAK